MTHELKTWPEPFAALLDGRKAFEIRKADRPFMVGDTLHLREWNPDGSGYTGRETAAVVTYLVSPGAWGLPPDLCVMGLASRAPERAERCAGWLRRDLRALDAASPPPGSSAREDGAQPKREPCPSAHPVLGPCVQMGPVGHPIDHPQFHANADGAVWGHDCTAPAPGSAAPAEERLRARISTPEFRAAVAEHRARLDVACACHDDGPPMADGRCATCLLPKHPAGSAAREDGAPGPDLYPNEKEEWS